MNVPLKPGESIDDLQRNGYRVIQSADNFRFGIDSVLLAWFAEVRANETVADLCTGTGVVMLLMDARNRAGDYTGLEIQPDMAEMASRSITLNDASDHMRARECDVKRASEDFLPHSFDVVTVNPPYLRQGDGKENPERAKAVSRHEILLTLEDAVREGSRLLKPGGRFYMVHRAARSAEVIETMCRHRLAPEKLCFVHSFREKEASLLLISGIRDGRNGTRILPPVVLYDEPGQYTEETHRILYE